MIDIKNLKYAYPVFIKNSAPKFIFNGLNLQIEAGAFLALTGGCGVGKTTLLEVINGIIPHSTGGTFGGNVLISGVNTRETGVNELSLKVGYAAEDAESFLICNSVAEEIAFALENRGMEREKIQERIEKYLSLFEITEYADKSPGELSGGQKQMALIAVILAMETPIVILDKPAANLDMYNKKKVYDVLQKLNKQNNITIIAAEDEIELIRQYAGRVIVLNNGIIETDYSCA